MGKFSIGAGLGVAVGVLIGWLLFTSADPGPGPGARSSGVVMIAPDPEGANEAEDLVRPELPETSPPTERGEKLSFQEAQSRIAALEEALAEVGVEAADAQETLEVIREEAREAEAADEKKNARLPFPEGLPERFEQDVLMTAMGEALSKIGGEISAVDCTEYPCIVYADLPGRGIPPPAEFKAFMDDPAMAEYAQDSRMHFAYDDTDDEGNHLARHSGFAFFPKSTSKQGEGNDLGERVHKRVREWRKASAPPPEP